MPLPPVKELVTEAEAGAKGIFSLWLRVMKILDTQDKHAKLIDKQAAQIEALREAVNVLLAREDLLLAKIEAAAAKATADMAGRLGRIEGILEARDRRDGPQAKLANPKPPP
jgi:hypothetical protein